MVSFTNQFIPKSRSDWRRWLSENYDAIDNVWLVLYNQSSGKVNLTYSEAVDEALCFGWIDSIAKKRDEHSRYQYFAKRKPKSNWSKVNKDKVKHLTEAGLMHASGQVMVDLAKQTGTWDALNEVIALIEPDDLKALLKKNKEANKHWQNFSPSIRRGILEWLLNAKRPETRAKRLAEIIAKAREGKKAFFEK